MVMAPSCTHHHTYSDSPAAVSLKAQAALRTMQKEADDRELLEELQGEEDERIAKKRNKGKGRGRGKGRGKGARGKGGRKGREKVQDGPPADTAKATENPPTENVDDQTGCSHEPTIDVDAAEDDVPTQQRSSRLRRKRSRLAGETSKLKRLKVMSPSSSAKKSRSRQGDPGDADDKAVGPGEQSVPGELVGLNHDELLEKPKRKKRKSKSRLGKPCKTDKPQDTEEVQDPEAQEMPIPPSPMVTEPDVDPEHEKKKAEEKAKVEQAAKDLVFLNKSGRYRISCLNGMHYLTLYDTNVTCTTDVWDSLTLTRNLGYRVRPFQRYPYCSCQRMYLIWLCKNTFVWFI